MTQPIQIIDKIQPSEPQTHVQVKFPDGRVFEGPLGLPLEAYIQRAEGANARQIVAAQTDDHIADLNEPVSSDVSIHPVANTSDAGFRVYQRSMIFLLDVVVRELEPDTRIGVEHALTYGGGLYCRVLNGNPLTAAQLQECEKRMRDVASQDEPIKKVTLTNGEAIEYFRSVDQSKVVLLTQVQRNQVQVHQLRGVRKFFFDGVLVPSTGYLQGMALRPYLDGFVLQFPEKGKPPKPVHDSTRLNQVFTEYGAWLDRLGVRDVTTLNQAIIDSRSREISLVSEALHAQKIAEIATQIVRERSRVKLVTIAGPSSSGKTTFARRLAVQLLANGVRPYPISLDDYFLPREETPKGDDGSLDYESLHALDLQRFNRDLAALIRGEPVALPHFDFVKGTSQDGEPVSLSPDHVMLIEGIHGLNPELLTQIPPENVFRIYASALTQLKLDRLNRIPTTDTRLIRRMVRDAATRGYGAQDTIARWATVVRGEEKWIFPFQENADVMFNSALVYELAALRPLAEPLLRQVDPGTAEYIEARRLLSFLQWFKQCDSEIIPEDSILREFTGGSIFADGRYPLKLY
jgi:uridine kinase